MVFNTLWSICVDKYFDKVPDITFNAFQACLVAYYWIL
jgi:hypothetical protein